MSEDVSPPIPPEADQPGEAGAEKTSRPAAGQKQGPPVEASAKASQSEHTQPPTPPDPTETAVEAADEPASLRALRQAMSDKLPVEGKVIGWNNGGFHVVVGDLTAFCPHSEMEIGQAGSPKSYLDKSYRFHPLRIQKKGRRIVLSRAAHLKAERARQRAKARKRIVEGAVLEGRVASLTGFGAFIDLGEGIQGLVHVSEISWRRVSEPGEQLKVGQQVKVKVCRVEKAGKRISLSIRALEPDPWREVLERYPQGSLVSGRVEKATNFGAFIELEPGLTGLLPSSAMSIPRATNPARLYPPGKKVSVRVVAIDTKRQRISLAPEGSALEGSRVDYKAYVKSQHQGGSTTGFNALANALRKLQRPVE